MSFSSRGIRIALSLGLAVLLWLILIGDVAFGQDCTTSSWTSQSGPFPDGTAVIDKDEGGVSNDGEPSTASITIRTGDDTYRVEVTLTLYRDGNLLNTYYPDTVNGAPNSSVNGATGVFEGAQFGDNIPEGSHLVVTWDLGGQDGPFIEPCDEFRIQTSIYEPMNIPGQYSHAGTQIDVRQLGWEEGPSEPPCGTGPAHCHKVGQWALPDPSCLEPVDDDKIRIWIPPEAKELYLQGPPIGHMIVYDGDYGGYSDPDCPVRHNNQGFVPIISMDWDTGWLLLGPFDVAHRDNQPFEIMIDPTPQTFGGPVYHWFYDSLNGPPVHDDTGPTICENIEGVTFCYTMDHEEDDGFIDVYIDGDFEFKVSLEEDELKEGEHCIEIAIEVDEYPVEVELQARIGRIPYTTLYRYEWDESMTLDGEPDCQNCGCAGELVFDIFGPGRPDEPVSDEDTKEWKTDDKDPINDDKPVFDEDENERFGPPEWYPEDELFDWPFPHAPVVGDTWLDHLAIGFDPNIIEEENLIMTVYLPFPANGVWNGGHYAAVINSIPQNSTAMGIMLNQLRYTFKDLFNVLMVLTFGTAAVRAVLQS